MEDVNPVKKITVRNYIEIRTKGRPKNKWRDEAINGVNELKLRNWGQIVKDRIARNDLVQPSKRYVWL
jgi:hypothetical protein